MEEVPVWQPSVDAGWAPAGWRLDVEAYCRRLDVDGPLSPTLDVLRLLHRHQATTIVYENLDIHLGRAIRVDLPGVERKLVHRARGGYCFELNGLLAGVLEEIGFRVVRVGARVRRGSAGVLRARTHMALLVDADGQRWLADVGFGGATPLDPLPLVPDQPVRQGAWAYRLVVEPAGIWVLQTWQDDTWTDLYAFTEEPLFQPDIEMANHFTATHQSSRFVHTLTAQLPGPRAQLYLRGRQLEVVYPRRRTVQVLPDDRAVVRVLASRFHLCLPADTCFVAPLSGGWPAGQAMEPGDGGVGQDGAADSREHTAFDSGTIDSGAIESGTDADAGTRTAGAEAGAGVGQRREG